MLPIFLVWINKGILICILCSKQLLHNYVGLGTIMIDYWHHILVIWLIFVIVDCFANDWSFSTPKPILLVRCDFASSFLTVFRCWILWILISRPCCYLLSRSRRCWRLLANSSSSLQSLQPQMQVFNLKTAAKTTGWHNERKQHVNILMHAQNTLSSPTWTHKVLIKSKSGTLLWAWYMERHSYSITKKRKKTTRRYESRKSNETKSFMYKKMEGIIISNL
jgi:hypothetical protein